MIVPVYDVEEYLAECLDSLLAQTYPGLEIVVVDDGSTDGSHAIAASYARRHRRISLVRTDNHGLGAARNTGVAHARGDYLGFLDSDDTMLPDAIERLVGALEESGSDFAVGSVLRWFEDGREEPIGWMRPLHRERRLRTTLEQDPRIMRDVFAWNKLFRRTFWERNGLAWAEGIRYEDQPCTIRAYLLADAFDVLVRPVVRYRQRPGSISQQRHLVDDLRDRLVSKRLGTDFVLAHASEPVRRTWFTVGLCGDMPGYLRVLPDASEEFWEVLVEGVRSLWSHGWRLCDGMMPAAWRVAGFLVQERRREDAVRVVSAYLPHEASPLKVERDGETYVDLPLLGDPSVPQDLFVAGAWTRA